jgi:CheY-like chemotaxis protein
MKNKINCILLIDDDEPTNFISQMIIEEADCAAEIQIAYSGGQAIDYLTSKGTSTSGQNTYPRPDLIFLDINMPAMNGWEFLQKYNSLEKEHKGNIVIIMLTTSLNPDDRARSKDFPDVSGFENKPLTRVKLEALLKKHFPEKYL